MSSGMQNDIQRCVFTIRLRMQNEKSIRLRRGIAPLGFGPVFEDVQPAGNAGAVTPSNNCDSNTALLVVPNCIGYEIVPRFSAPSCSVNVGVILAPQAPVAVKLNGRVTAAPPATTTP